MRVTIFLQLFYKQMTRVVAVASTAGRPRRAKVTEERGRGSAAVIYYSAMWERYVNSFLHLQ
jgi:hypothetical protein